MENYEGCLDMALIDELGLESARSYLHDKYGHDYEQRTIDIIESKMRGHHEFGRKTKAHGIGPQDGSMNESDYWEDLLRRAG